MSTHVSYGDGWKWDDRGTAASVTFPADSSWVTTTNITFPQAPSAFDPDPTDCMVCGEEIPELGVCELCRQAILLMRRKVLEQMARDLEDMC